SSCTIKGVYPSDSGVYWCESDSRECSNTINIRVTTGVILQGPAVPLTEGDSVTLNCSYKEKYAKESTSNFSTAFYRNGTFIEKTSDGRLSFIHVSKENEGSYKCVHPTKGESPEIWLEVRGDDDENNIPVTTPDPDPTPPIALPKLLSTILLFILYTCILILAVYTYRKWAQGLDIFTGPAVPLTEGDSVTLNCSYKEKYAKESTSNFSAAFYRNGAFIGNRSEGRLSFIHVSKENEGSYKCEHPTKGESPEIWLEPPPVGQ
ncbi:Fc receptor-like protein 5, partial [Neolamprologus brichardi]|uniref:Fc receptor-like protein 5 n=1 Tax=Neolamprologus brichardi TaxID=32507 RepID=UPI001643C1CF